MHSFLKYLMLAVCIACISIAGCASSGHVKQSDKFAGFSGVWEDAGNIGITLMMKESEEYGIKGYVYFTNALEESVVLPIEYVAINKRYAVLGVPYGKSITSDPVNSFEFEITLFNTEKIIGNMMDHGRGKAFDFVLTRLPEKKAEKYWEMAENFK